MKTRHVALAVLMLFLIAENCVYGQSLDKLVPASELIFRGTVLQTGTSTIDIPDTNRLAVVRVDEIFHAARTFQHLRSQSVTVMLADTSEIRRGDQRTFFTRGWYFGSSVGVAEIGHTDAASGERATRLVADIKKVRLEHADMEIKERLATADAVVIGRVIAIRKSAIRPKGLTEHDPDWHEAEIKVDRVLKGAVGPGNTVTLLFARSEDVMWYRAPKFRVGTEGTWLLRPFEFAGAKLKLPAAVDNKDFFPKAEQSKVERLLK